jgi:hypothetical protein
MIRIRPHPPVARGLVEMRLVQIGRANVRPRRTGPLKLRAATVIAAIPFDLQRGVIDAKALFEKRR